MPRSTFTDPVRELIKARNFCHVSTLNENGSIHSTLVWVDADAEHIVLNSAQGRRTSTSSSRPSSSRPPRRTAGPSSTPSARSTRAAPTRR